MTDSLSIIDIAYLVGLKASQQPTHAAHSPWGASSAERWFACPGSVNFCRDIPDVPSAYALEGTAAHKVLERALRGEANWDTIRPSYVLEENWPSTLRAVKIGVEYVQDILDEYPDAVMLLEHKFVIPSSVVPGQVFGTNDICIYVPSMRLLYVIDYKHGAGKFVEVLKNKQIRFYELGALNYDPSWTIDTVVGVIIQPRIEYAEPIREEWITADEVRAFGGAIDQHIEKTLAPDAPLVPGDEQCFFCRGAVTCPARQRHFVQLAGETFSHVKQITAESLTDPVDMSLDHIGHVLAAGKLALKWVESVREYGYSLQLSGMHIPGQKLVEATPRRGWALDEFMPPAVEGLTDDDRENIAQAFIARSLAEDAGVADEKFRPSTLLGITKAEQLLKDSVREAAPKGKKKEMVAEAVKRMAFLTTKKSSGTLSLVSEDDPRPAVNRAAGAFGDIVQIPHIADGE